MEYLHSASARTVRSPPPALLTVLTAIAVSPCLCAKGWGRGPGACSHDTGGYDSGSGVTGQEGRQIKDQKVKSKITVQNSKMGGAGMRGRFAIRGIRSVRVADSSASAGFCGPLVGMTGGIGQLGPIGRIGLMGAVCAGDRADLVVSVHFGGR